MLEGRPPDARERDLAAGDRDPCTCAACGTLGLLGRRWMPDVVAALQQDEPVRFNALQRQVGDVSARTLTDRLRALEDAGLVAREDRGTAPPHVAYRLTDDGRALAEALEPVVAWARDRAGHDG